MKTTRNNYDAAQENLYQAILEDDEIKAERGFEAARTQAILALADKVQDLIDVLRPPAPPARPAWDLDTEEVASGLGPQYGAKTYTTQDGRPATPEQIKTYLQHKDGDTK